MAIVIFTNKGARISLMIARLKLDRSKFLEVNSFA